VPGASGGANTADVAFTDPYDAYLAPPDPHRARRSALLVGAVLAGLVATGIGAFALMSSLANLHDPGFRCDGFADDDACLAQAQIARPFQLNAGLWAIALAAAVCAMVFVTALLAQSRRRPT
jgi:hypothetical protein